MIRTAIVGRGMAGRTFHRPLIEAVPDFTLAGVVGQSDAASVIADAGIDLVIIATPNNTHAELAERALLAGKHVVIDKPFVLRLEDGDRLIELARREGRMLTVFHNRRWDGDFLTVAALQASRRLGEVGLFEAHWDRFRPMLSAGWRERVGPGAGTLWNLAPHMIDQMVMLFGMPQSVQADIGSQRAGALVDDYFALTFQYGNMRAIIGASNLVAVPRCRFGVHGTGGSFVKHGLDPQEERLTEGRSPLEADFGEDPCDRHGVFSDEAGAESIATEPGSYVEFYRRVSSSICHGTAPPVDPRDTLRGVRLILAARASAERGHAVELDAA